MTFKERMKDTATRENLLPELSFFDKKYAYILADIALKIKQKRKSLNMTQKEFATFLGVTQGMVSKWEGAEYNFTIEKLIELFDRLDIKIAIKEKAPKQEIMIYKHYVKENNWNSTASAGNGVTYKNSLEGVCA